MFIAILFFDYLSIIKTSTDITFYHIYPMIFVIFTNFFTGFLFTTFPRFLSVNPVDKKIYTKLYLLFSISSIIFFISNYFILLLPLGLTTLFFSYLWLYIIIKDLDNRSFVTNRYDTSWIVNSIFFGLLSNFLFIIYHFTNLQIFRSLAIESGFYLYIFMLVLTISQKMIPFFTENMITGYKSNRSNNFLEKVFYLLSLKIISSIFEINIFETISTLLIFLLLTYEILKWRLPLFKVPSILWILYLSMYWIIPASFLMFIQSLYEQNIFEKIPIHIYAIGYITTILIGFGSRIILAQSGYKPLADKFTQNIFIFIQLVVCVRVVAGLAIDFIPNLYLDLISLSSFLWICLFCIWSYKYLPILLFEKKD